MTAEERAEKLHIELLGVPRGSHASMRILADAIRAAENDKIEECAKIAETCAPHFDKNSRCGCGECVGATGAADEIRKLKKGGA